MRTLQLPNPAHRHFALRARKSGPQVSSLPDLTLNPDPSDLEGFLHQGLELDSREKVLLVFSLVVMHVACKCGIIAPESDLTIPMRPQFYADWNRGGAGRRTEWSAMREARDYLIDAGVMQKVSNHQVGVKSSGYWLTASAMVQVDRGLHELREVPYLQFLASRGEQPRPEVISTTKVDGKRSAKLPNGTVLEHQRAGVVSGTVTVLESDAGGEVDRSRDFVSRHRASINAATIKIRWAEYVQERTRRVAHGALDKPHTFASRVSFWEVVDAVLGGCESPMNYVDPATNTLHPDALQTWRGFLQLDNKHQVDESPTTSGGRFYYQAQSMPTLAREFLEIDGEITAECDYKACQGRMAYSIAGLVQPDDPYAALAPTLSRTAAKKFYVYALGCYGDPTLSGLKTSSVAYDARTPKEAEACQELRSLTSEQWAGLVAHLQSEGVWEVLCGPVWSVMQRLESDIALHVMQRFMEETGSAILHFHDSFRVKASLLPVLRRIMAEVWEGYFGSPAATEEEPPQPYTQRMSTRDPYAGLVKLSARASVPSTLGSRTSPTIPRGYRSSPAKGSKTGVQGFQQRKPVNCTPGGKFSPG